MSKFRTILAVMIAGAFAPAAFCTSTAISLQDYGFNVNGTWYSDTTAVPGLVAPSSFTASSSTTQGQGTLTLTFNPGAAGTYNVDAWIFDALSTPFYNEYGATSGTAAAGQSWQIDIPDYDSDADHTGNIIAHSKAASLDNANHIPGTTDDYLGTCSTGANCNDATSMAMGFKFTLTKTQEEVITLSLSQTNPGSGFYLEQIHPVDGANVSATDLFFTGNGVAQPSGAPPPPPPPGVPEPASWALFAAGIAVAGFMQRRRFFRA